MLNYAALARRPAAFRGVTGMTPADFDALLDDFTAAQADRRRSATRTKRGTPRVRAAGAGHPHALDDRHRLLLALSWLRLYATYEVLGLLFGLDRGNAHRNAEDVLETLAGMETSPFERPSADRRKLRSLAAVMGAFP